MKNPKNSSKKKGDLQILSPKYLLKSIQNETNYKERLTGKKKNQKEKEKCK